MERSHTKIEPRSWRNRRRHFESRGELSWTAFLFETRGYHNEKSTKKQIQADTLTKVTRGTSSSDVKRSGIPLFLYIYVSCVKQHNKTIALRSRSFQVTQWPDSSVSSHKAMVASPPDKNRWDTLFRSSDRLFVLPAIILHLDVERTGSDWIGLFGWLKSSIGIRNSFTCSTSGWCIASPAAATHH